MILGFPDYTAQGRRLAAALDQPYAEIAIHRFPDGESRVTLPPQLPPRVTLCRSLDQPNDKLVELLLAARTARAHGADHLTLVAPYLCYMRQDIAFHPGEAVSQRIIGGFLGDLFDAVVTVDPHLHRIERLDQAVVGAEAVSLSAMPAAAAFLRAHGGQPLLVGPDEESAQWAGGLAEAVGLDWSVADKDRRGDRDVTIVLPEGDWDGREVILVDDMASTGRTLETVARQLRAAGVSRLSCLITHALCGDEAWRALRAAGITELWSSDSVTHPSNAFSLAPLLAEAVNGLA